MGSNDPIALRLQHLDQQARTLVLASLAADRDDKKVVTPAAVSQLFIDFAIPAPVKTANTSRP